MVAWHILVQLTVLLGSVLPLTQNEEDEWMVGRHHWVPSMHQTLVGKLKKVARGEQNQLPCCDKGVLRARKLLCWVGIFLMESEVLPVCICSASGTFALHVPDNKGTVCWLFQMLIVLLWSFFLLLQLFVCLNGGLDVVLVKQIIKHWELWNPACLINELCSLDEKDVYLIHYKTSIVCSVVNCSDNLKCLLVH